MLTLTLILFRDLDRERSKLEQQEKKVIADIKKMAKAGQMVCRQSLFLNICTYIALATIISIYMTYPRLIRLNKK